MGEKIPRWKITFIEQCGHSMTQRFKNIILNKPLKKGLYLLGQTAENPHTGETFYWVKVGKSKSVKGRFDAYRTNNPCVYYIDWYETNDADNLEGYFHQALEPISTIIHRDEWFQVSKIEYLKICEKGFVRVDQLYYLKYGIPLL